jgi:hypothetical protein
VRYKSAAALAACQSDVFCSTVCQPNAGAGLTAFEHAYPQSSTQFQGVTLMGNNVQRV